MLIIKFLENFPRFTQTKDKELNIKYIYNNPDQNKHQFTLIFLPESDSERWANVQTCDHWINIWGIDHKYRTVIPKGVDNADLLIKLIEKEKTMFKDNNSKRIVIGGIADGGNVSLMVY